MLKERGLWPERGLVFECPTTYNRRQAEARLRRIVNQYRVPPAAARNLQAAIVQGTMLYPSELTWNGKENVEREYQLAINRMSRASLGAFQITPRGREWVHTCQGLAGSPESTLRTAPHRQAPRGPGAGGDSRQEGYDHRQAEEGSSNRKRRDCGGSGVERGEKVPGTDRGG